MFLYINNNLGRTVNTKNKKYTIKSQSLEKFNKKL